MFSRRAIAVSTRALTMRQAPIAARSFTTIAEKERAEEKAYFSKQDAKLLKKLVEKMEKREELNNETKEKHDAICDDLNSLFENHGLDRAGKDQLLYTELMEWKRHQH